MRWAKFEKFCLEMNNKSLINFVDARMVGKYCEISTNGVSDDYYCLENLISSDISKRNLGFMAISFSKPPIEIIIKFKWKIDLKVLKVTKVLTKM